MANKKKTTEEKAVIENWTKVSEEIKENIKSVEIKEEESNLYEAEAKSADEETVDTYKEFNATYTDDNSENIDDTIAECTGKIEEATETEETIVTENKNIPWWIARAKRGGDYYNY